MILCAHNTMTYRSPKKLWMKLIKSVAKCQGVDYKTQHEKYGVGAFDLRIFWDEDGHIEFRHGKIAYDGKDLFTILKYCEDNNIIVRMLFEERSYTKDFSKKHKLKEKFITLCTQIERDYPNLKIYSGRNTGTWERVYKFKMDDPKEIEYCSSSTSLFGGNTNTIIAKVDDIIPSVYASLMNHKNYKKAEEIKDDTLVLFDFVNSLT